MGSHVGEAGANEAHHHQAYGEPGECVGVEAVAAGVADEEADTDEHPGGRRQPKGVHRQRPQSDGREAAVGDHADPAARLGRETCTPATTAAAWEAWVNSPTSSTASGWSAPGGATTRNTR